MWNNHNHHNRDHESKPLMKRETIFGLFFLLIALTMGMASILFGHPIILVLFLIACLFAFGGLMLLGQ